MKKSALTVLGLASAVLILVFYHSVPKKVEKEPPLTGWQRSVVQDGPAIAALWQKAIERALAQHRSSVPADLIVGIMLTESMGKPRARNQSGAVGLLGVRPIVCRELREKKCELLNPHTNITLGVRYLKLLQKYGFEDEKLILAYGVGPTRAREILKTRKLSARHSRYVRKVLYARSLGNRTYSDS